MKAVSFEYLRPRDTAEAIGMLAGMKDEAKAIAGGQSLGPMLNLRLARPRVLVDIRRCPELRAFTDEGDAVVYGAALTHTEIEDGVVPDATDGWLRSIAQGIAYRAIRNRGTLGGSLAHADPAADWLTAMLALDAEVVTQGATGIRAQPMSDFVRGPFLTNLAPGDLLLGVRVYKPAATARWGWSKRSIKRGEFAQALCAVAWDPDRDSTRSVVGAIEQMPVVLVDHGHETPNSLVKAEQRLIQALPQMGSHSLRPSLRMHAANWMDALNRTGMNRTGMNW